MVSIDAGGSGLGGELVIVGAFEEVCEFEERLWIGMSKGGKRGGWESALAQWRSHLSLIRDRSSVDMLTYHAIKRCTKNANPPS